MMSSESQLNFWNLDGTGTLLKERGLDSVESHETTFVEKMRRRAVEIATESGTVTSDDLRSYAKAYGIEPNHQNAWGAIFRGKLWRSVGRKKSTVNSNHSREIRVWALTEEV
jgi:hypothetical protein